jgi:hypothetical protein
VAVTPLVPLTEEVLQIGLFKSNIGLLICREAIRSGLKDLDSKSFCITESILTDSLQVGHFKSDHLKAAEPGRIAIPKTVHVQ